MARRLAAALAGAQLATANLVQVGLYINQIDNVNGRTGAWLGDVVTFSTWNESSFPAGGPVTNVVNGEVSFSNEERRVQTGDAVAVTKCDYVTFYFDGEYWLFPFDEQRLKVSVELNGLNSSEAVIIPHGSSSGIRPINPDTGRHFKTAQYRVKEWFTDFHEHDAIGMPYSKSRASLIVVVERRLPYYMLTCFFLPGLTIVFAMMTFLLPLTPITPRVMISFTSFLAQFVHLKSQMILVPTGVWCWLFSELLFSMTILAIAILANMASGKLNGISPTAAKGNDRAMGTSLPISFLVGLVILYLLREYHVWVTIVLTFICLALHTAILSLYVRRAFREQAGELDEDEEEWDSDGTLSETGSGLPGGRETFTPFKAA